MCCVAGAGGTIGAIVGAGGVIGASAGACGTSAGLNCIAALGTASVRAAAKTTDGLTDFSVCLDGLIVEG